MAYHEDVDRYEDVLLDYDDIQLLSSQDGVVAFFGKLRYNVDERVAQTTAAMGFTSESLHHAIKYIERVASHQDFDAFSVYLFELNRLTVAVRNEIIKGFRNRSGNYLLVLVDDYERLDFVLIERYTQMITTREETYEVAQLLPGTKPVNVRPRVLQVLRRNPGDVELRVLRRFTYTEGDTVAQYEKLLNAYIVATWSEPFFNNRALFSDYYLTKRLPEQKEWKDERSYSALRKAFRKLRMLYDDAREECSNQPEQVICMHLLEPIFQELGFTTQRTKADSKEDALKSYYRLFALAASPTTEAKPLAVCLTYPWGRNLDGKDDLRDAETPDENPGAVVVTLLDAGETDWAIVTNGIIWRLYAAKAHSRATNYYEVNLQETLALDPSKREDAFRYFWLFFRAASFLPTERVLEGEKRALNLLDELLIQSDLQARELGERLKNRVFEEIFPYFARGFVNHAHQHDLLPAHLDTLNAEERKRLLEPYFMGTLTFLYRLLFLFYAESRDLLPVRQERGYYEHSLECLKREIAQHAGDLQDRVASRLTSYSENSTAIYDRLIVLFAAVDKGNAALNVPIYNGGLFMTNPPAPSLNEPQEITVARFLKEHKITDRQLALGLDRMARDVDEKLSRARLAAGEANEHSHSLIFIDYKSLGVRHLGSIYEGLLEFKLCIASEEMALVEGKRTEEIITYSEAKQENRRILKVRQGKELKERLYVKGAVYLENDRRERKATGSYYTPDYIVKYIVEQTVGPILKDKLEKLREVFRAAQENLQSEQKKARALQRTDVVPEHETYKSYRVSLNEAFFDLKVLDPAMGSGHFLVEVVDYITDQMAKFLNSFRWNPVVYELELTRKKIEDGMKEQGVTVDRDKLIDLNLLKRRVLKSCIYGVDLNPMAVELAKVSLWLDCFTLGAPLSFLDHHIKCGNSLIGADVEAVHKGIRENLFGYQFDYLLQSAQLMRGVSKLSDVTAKEVKESHESYQQAYEALAPYKRLFDIWLSQYFGNKKAQDVANEHAKSIIENDYTHINTGDLTIINTALPLATSKRFFHWELEFPEVFFDEAERKPDGGFDAVVGNPPYIPNEQMQLNERDYYSVYYPVSLGKYDLSVVFLQRCSTLLSKPRKLGMIVPTIWQTGDNYRLFREQNIIQLRFAPSTIVNLPFDVFADAYVDTCIAIFNKPAQSILSVYAYAKKYKIDEGIIAEQEFKKISIEQVKSDAGYRIFNNGRHYDFLAKFSTPTSISLGKLTDACQGPVESFYDYSDIALDENWIPYISCDVYRYELEQAQRKFVHFGKNNPLIRFYTNPRILIRRIVSRSNRLMAVVAQESFVVKKDLNPFILTVSAYDLLFLLANMNSTLHSYLYTEASTAAGKDDFRQTTLTALQALPIHGINFITSPSERARYLDKARLLYQQCLSKDDQDCVLGFVNHHLSQEPEASDIVHDLLAFLAEEMLRLNKEKRALQKTFLDYFVDALQVKPDKDKTGLEALTGKSRLQEFAGDYQKGGEPLTPAELWEIVQKNRSHLNAGRVGLKERILERYQESLDQVLPLKEQLKRTDALIDRVVYRLYGLTEEEIAIVEGRE